MPQFNLKTKSTEANRRHSDIEFFQFPPITHIIACSPVVALMVAAYSTPPARPSLVPSSSCVVHSLTRYPSIRAKLSPFLQNPLTCPHAATSGAGAQSLFQSSTTQWAQKTPPSRLKPQGGGHVGIVAEEVGHAHGVLQELALEARHTRAALELGQRGACHESSRQVVGPLRHCSM